MFTPLLSLLVPAVALAGDLTPLYEGPLVADGGSDPLTVMIYAPGLGTTDKIKVVPGLDETEVLSAAALPDGRLRLQLTVPRVEAPTELPLEIRIKGALNVEETVSLPLTPPVEGSLVVSVSPAKIPAGGEATVTIKPSGAAFLDAEDRAVALRASAGTLSAPAFSGGAWTATYTPPEGLEAPVAAVITALDLTAPEAVYGGAVLPIGVVKEKSFLEASGSTNTLTAAGREYGPFTADDKGRFAVPIEMYPSLKEGTLTTNADGATRSRSVAIDPGAAPQIAFAPLPEGVALPVSSSKRSAWLYAGRADGSPWTGAGAELTVEGADRVRVDEVGGGWYKVGFSPQPGAPWALNASLGGAADSLSGVGAAPRPNLSLSVNPDKLSGEKEELEVKLRAKDDEGTALPGLALSLTAVNADDRRRKLEDNEDGTYSLSFEVREDTAAAMLLAAPRPDASILPPARLRIWPAIAELPADEQDLGRVWVVAEDAYGQPVPGLEIKLAVPVGDGSVPPTVTTDEAGMASAVYTAGEALTPVVLRARAGGLESFGLLWQGVAAPEEGLGHAAQLERIDAWRSATPAARVAQKEYKPVLTAAPVAAATGIAAPVGGGDSAAGDTGGGREPGGIIGPEPGELSMLEVRVGFIDLGYTYDSLADNDEDLPCLEEDPCPASFSRPFPTGILGFGGSAEFWYDRWFAGAELKVRTGTYSIAIGDTVYTDGLPVWTIGARGRYPIPVIPLLRPEVALGYQGSNAMAFYYTDDAGNDFDLETVAFSGFRTGLGLSAVVGPAELSGEGAITWGAPGSWSEVNAGVEVEVWNGVHAGAAFLAEWRDLATDVNTQDTEITDQQTGMWLTVGYRM